jgi:LDH2 family malate/lactate/ureidoglycolate dehydrogenase
MKIPTLEARALAIAFLVRHGMSAEHAQVVADHLIYATRAGHAFAGLSRLLPIAERLRRTGVGGEIRIVSQTDKSAVIDGANVIGYVTSLLGIDTAIGLARKGGVGIVGVNNSWFSGMLRYYVERAADAGLIGIHAANSTAIVAPFGGADRVLGTNPFAFAFPAEGPPLVIDFATAAIMWGDAVYHQQLGKPLPPGCAVDSAGAPTVDPGSALTGAILGWGGARGFAVSMAVQALAILAGSDSVVGEAGKWGYLFIVIDPELLMPLDDFKQRIAALRFAVEGSRPIPGGPPVRVPGTATQVRLAAAVRNDWIEIDDEILRRIAS